MEISTNDGSGSLWRPLRSSTFRNLLVADVVSDVGTFMQSVGAAWLMVSLNAGPMYLSGLADRESILRAASAGIGQAKGAPKEWGGGAEGYGERIGNANAQHVIHPTS